MGHLLATGGYDGQTRFWCRSRPGDAWLDRAPRDLHNDVIAEGGAVLALELYDPASDSWKSLLQLMCCVVAGFSGLAATRKGCLAVGTATSETVPWLVRLMLHGKLSQPAGLVDRLCYRLRSMITESISFSYRLCFD